MLLLWTLFLIPIYSPLLLLNVQSENIARETVDSPQQSDLTVENLNPEQNQSESATLKENSMKRWKEDEKISGKLSEKEEAKKGKSENLPIAPEPKTKNKSNGKIRKHQSSSESILSTPTDSKAKGTANRTGNSHPFMNKHRSNPIETPTETFIISSDYHERPEKLLHQQRTRRQNDNNITTSTSSKMKRVSDFSAFEDVSFVCFICCLTMALGIYVSIAVHFFWFTNFEPINNEVTYKSVARSMQMTQQSMEKRKSGNIYTESSSVSHHITSALLYSMILDKNKDNTREVSTIDKVNTTRSEMDELRKERAKYILEELQNRRQLQNQTAGSKPLKTASVETTQRSVETIRNHSNPISSKSNTNTQVSSGTKPNYQPMSPRPTNKGSAGKNAITKDKIKKRSRESLIMKFPHEQLK